jgi:hypothetical protein
MGGIIMKQKKSAEQFLEAQFDSQPFRQVCDKALKEFVALGFLSAHTQLLTSEKVEQEKTILKQLPSWKYLQELIVRNQQKMNDNFVQSLSEYIQILQRKRVYRYGKSVHSVQAVSASLTLGIDLYQKKYLVTTKL